MITKTIASIPFKYTYDANHARSHFLIDGDTAYKNSGEFHEVACKAVRGYKAEKDANTPFDKGSDIEETNTSIKSNGCSLTDKKLADNKEDFLKEYFKRVHSTNVDYVIIIDETVTIYNMEMKDFKEFTALFAKWDSYSKKIRIKTTGKMIKWLEERTAQVLFLIIRFTALFL